MEEFLKTLPQHSMSWLKGKATLSKYQEFWSYDEFHKGIILAQQSHKAHPSDVLLCSCPKTGTTWLKALAFAIVTRQNFDESTSPLLTTFPHDCIPCLEKDLEQIEDNHNNPGLFPLVATHAPYTSLPQSVISSKCKIVYIYRNVKDVIVSDYHFTREAVELSMEDAPFNEAFNDFYEGFSLYGPYWNHILGYWKASQERPGEILFLKYEDMKRDPINNVKKLAEFIGYPFSTQEANGDVVESIIKLCSFEKLSNLQVNKSGKYGLNEVEGLERRTFFRKATDGDWANYFTDEMKEKIDKLMDEKLSGTGLVLK